MFIRKTTVFKWTTLILVVALVFVFAGCNTMSETSNADGVIKIKGVYDEAEIAAMFDFYDYEETSEYNRITAFKSTDVASLEGKINVNLSDVDNVRVAYDVQYDYEAEIIYLSISMFDENEDFLSAQVAEAFPIYYDDGNFDALFDIDGKKVYLSEIQSGEAEDCFFASGFALSLFAAKLVTAAIFAAKVTAVIVGVVAVGGITYSVASLTKAKIQERTRVAEKEKTKKNPQYYYPATRKDGKLLIAASPLGLIQASKNIVTGSDFWAPEKYMAKDLVVTASGGFVGPERDSNKDGYYQHYHLVGRKGGHSFFSTPSGGKY